MTKGEGTLPSKEQLSQATFSKPSNLCTFYLSPSALEKFAENSRITGCRVIYDGVTEVTHSGEKYGLRVGVSGIEGYPCPIMEFELVGSIDQETLLRAVWESSVRIQSPSGDSEFFFEDWNGYTEILAPPSIKSWSSCLLKQNIHPSEIFFLQQMEKGLNLGNVHKNWSSKKVS